MPSAGVRCGDCGDELPDPHPDECPSCGGTARRYAGHGTSTVNVTDEVSFRHYPRLAEAWWSDVITDREPGRDSRRHQIVFGAAFVETYLYEWVRDSVLSGPPVEWRRLETLFPLNDRRAVTKRWKEVPEKLREQGAIANTPNLGVTAWEETMTLLDYRHSLVHGTSSRPVGSGVSDDQLAPASLDVLDSLHPDWVPEVLCGVVDLLHAGTGTGGRPQWMRWPLPSLPSTEE